MDRLRKEYENKSPQASHISDNIVIFDVVYDGDIIIVSAFINPSTTEYEYFGESEVEYEGTDLSIPYFTRFDTKYYIDDFLRLPIM